MVKRWILTLLYAVGIIIPTVGLVFKTGFYPGYWVILAFEGVFVLAFGLFSDHEMASTVAWLSICLGLVTGILTAFVSPHFAWILVAYIFFTLLLSSVEEEENSDTCWDSQAQQILYAMRRKGFNPNTFPDRANFWKELWSGRR